MANQWRQLSVQWRQWSKQWRSDHTEQSMVATNGRTMVATDQWRQWSDHTEQSYNAGSRSDHTEQSMADQWQQLSMQWR